MDCADEAKVQKVVTIETPNVGYVVVFSSWIARFSINGRPSYGSWHELALWIQWAPAMHSRNVHDLAAEFITDTTLLQCTLVADGALPPAFAMDFEQLAEVTESSADVMHGGQPLWCNVEAAVILHERSRRPREEARVSNQAVDPFMLAAQ